MRTQNIKEYKTVCEASIKIAIVLLNEETKVKYYKRSNLKYIGKAISFYDENDNFLAYLNKEKSGLKLVVPTYSPIYK